MRRAVTNMVHIVTQHYQRINELQTEEAKGLNHMFQIFRKFDPPSFNGKLDSMAAVEWLGQMEKIFGLMDCSEEQKVTLVTYMFHEGADRWWESVLRMKLPDDPPMDWTTFEKVFYDKYFPKSVRQQKEREFLSLEQRNMTVFEYEAKFEDLSRFAPYLASDVEKMAETFQWGLKPSICSQVALLDNTTYAAVVRCARIVEYEHDVFLQSRKLKKKVRLDKKQKGKAVAQSSRRSPIGADRGKARVCRRCGNSHTLQCPRDSRTCYICSQQGHIA